MNTGTHGELANFIWRICNLLRGPYKRNEYRKVILPLTVLRRFDCVLAETKDEVLAANERYGGQGDEVSPQLLEAAAGRRFYNTSKLGLRSATGRLEPDCLKPQRVHSTDSRPTCARSSSDSAFEAQIAKMDEKNLLFQVVQAFSARVDLSPGACRQHADGLRVRGTDPNRRGAGKRGSGGALHAARGHSAHGQPAAVT